MLGGLVASCAISSRAVADATIATGAEHTTSSPVAPVAPAATAPSTSAPVVAVPATTPSVDTGLTAAAAQAVAALAAWAGANHLVLGADVLDVRTGTVLASANEHALMNPASNTKILTAATVLHRMGPDYRFTTSLFGHVEGDTVSELVLRGNGDPSLETSDLFRLGATLRALGVRHVGRVLVDQTYFDDAFVPPAFDQQPKEWAPFRAPVSAVALERNAVTLNVVPEAEGTPALVWFEPAGTVTVRGNVTTRKAGSGDGVRVTMTPDGPHLIADVGGFIGTGSPRQSYGKRVNDPRLSPGLALAEVLRTIGIDVRADVTLGGDAARERLAYIESAPLSVLVRELGKNSDNFYAETLLKSLGGFVKGAPAHTEDGAAAVLAWLDEIRANEPGTRLVNGSGLFDANRVSAFELAAALREAIVNPKIGPDFVAQLSIGGVDGTLHGRFKPEAKRRIIRAKTGTLDGVIALGGYVLGSDGKGAVCFSFILTGVTGHHADARGRIDRTVETIAASLGKQ